MKRLFYPENCASDFGLIGGKGENLYKLSVDFNVPAWVALPVDCFFEFLRSSGLDGRIGRKVEAVFLENAGAVSEEIRSMILAEDLPEDLVMEIEDLIESRYGSGFVSVRSSSADEDSLSNSFAGIHETYLFIKGARSISEHVKKVWASAYHERALSYRLDKGLSIHPVAMAVIIQKMVYASSSGVIFTADPATGNPHKVLISSVYGLGEGLVSGGLDADLVEYGKTSGEFSKNPARKESCYCFDREKGEGIKETSLSDARKDKLSLSDAQLQKLVATSLEIEKKYGRPQDIEFCFDGAGQLFILQSRPVTTVVEYGPAAANRLIWDNSNIIESYSGVTSPMTFSFIRHAYNIVYHCFSQVMGISEEKVIANQHVFENMLGLFRGQVYYNIVNWYRLVRLFPGFNYNRAFMESMMGLREKIELEDDEKQRGSSFLQKYFIEFPAFFRLLLRSAWNFLTIKSRVARFNANFRKHYYKWESMDFSRMPPHELMKLYWSMEKALLWNWKTPIINDFFVMVFYGSLKKCCMVWCGDENGSLQNELICGEGGIESTAPAGLLMRLALEIKRDPELCELFHNEKAGVLVEIISNKGEYSRIKAQISEYLDLYGFRCMDELKLEEPSLRENPLFIYQMIQNYLKLKDADSLDPLKKEKHERRIREDAEKRAFKAIGNGLLPRKTIFRWLLGNARLGVRNRENMRFARTRIYGLLRELINSAGAFFHREGLIEEEHDIYYLTIDELWDYVKGTAVMTNLKGLIDLRKEEFESYRDADTVVPDDHFETYGLAYHRNLFRNWSRPEPGFEKGELRGTGCCPGKVEGRVRVLRSPSEDMEINGDILVAGRTDPGWVPLYPAVSGILIERGSILSHSAIVAREMGIPAIVGIPNLLDSLEDGQSVKMDGQTGIVKIL